MSMFLVLIKILMLVTGCVSNLKLKTQVKTQEVLFMKLMRSALHNIQTTNQYAMNT